MKKLIVLLLFAVIFISCGPPIPLRGKVTDKVFIEEHTVLIPQYISTGKSMTMVMTPIFYPNRWRITLQDLKTGELFYFNTTAMKFDSLKQNDTIIVADYELP